MWYNSMTMCRQYNKIKTRYEKKNMKNEIKESINLTMSERKFHINRNFNNFFDGPTKYNTDICRAI